MKTTRGWMLVVGLWGVLAGCGDPHNLPTPDAAPDVSTYDPVARGQYIMNVTAACTFCHSPLLANGTRDPAKLLSGVDCFVDLDSPDFTDNHDGFGCLSTRNLTNHETGLKLRTDSEIRDAFQNGHRTDGKFLVPIMPYYIFHNMTDADAEAVVAYLRTVPGVDHTVKPNEPPFSSYNDGDFAGSGLPYVAPLTDAQIPMPGTGADMTKAMHGRYLTSKIGLCIDCHTPEKVPNTIILDTAKAFAGGKVFPKGTLGLVDPANTYPPFIVTRNLTSDTTGLGGWTKDEIKNAIAEGRDQMNKQVCAATHGGAISPYAALEPSDLDDIVEYISSLPPIVNDTAMAQCWPSPPVAVPATVGTAETVCGTPAVDEDLDGVANDGCGESGGQCFNGVDDDGDGVADDGCYMPCGNCAGPLVP